MKTKRRLLTVLLRGGLILSLCTFYIPAISSASAVPVANAIQSFTSFSTTDTDGDGIPDDHDSCANSNLFPTVIVNGCDAGITNVLFDSGCTMSDLIAECYAKINNQGDSVSCAEDIINKWRTAGLILDSEQRDLKTCVSNSNLQSDRALITGTVFDDSNGNGIQDDNEPGIGGVTVTLDGSIPAVTNVRGQYKFLIAGEGPHTITETDPSGVISTTPNELPVDGAPGNSYQADFGDFANNTTTPPEPTITTELPATTVLSPSSKTTPIPLPPPRCATDADCDDGLFCNGVETCVDGVCQKGESPCDTAQICREDVNCVDIVQQSASTALLPRRDERTLPEPLLLPNISYWLRVKIKAKNNVDLNKSVFSVEGDSQNYTGVSIDSARFKKIRTAFLNKNGGNVFWVPIDVQKNTAPGTLKIKITTDKTDAQQPFIEIVEGTFTIRENLFKR